jgi:hypothetical protein
VHEVAQIGDEGREDIEEDMTWREDIEEDMA